MMKKLYIIIFLVGLVILKAQTPIPTTTVFNAPLPNYGINSYTRASQQINLTPGFVYGFVTGGATNLQNLNISSSPSYVNNNYNDPISDPTYFNFNPDLIVGITEGAGNVDAVGGFNYNFPIVSSPGTNGIEPKLSIAYNSNASNSWLGKGFNLSGLSFISRTNRSQFFDLNAGGIFFSSGDVFALDGNRLLQNSGAYGQPGSTYKLEVENFNIITSVNLSGNGPQHFIVTTPNGITMEYGNTPDSRAKDVSNTEILSWFINRIYDEFGNYMDFTYDNSNGEIRISNIKYTGNLFNNKPTYNTIEFEYVDRSDNASSYIAGREFKRTKILKRITSKDINNNIVRRYNLTYQYEFASLLSKITETDGQGNQLNPTFIEWTKSNKLLGKFTQNTQIAQNVSDAFVAPNAFLTVAADMNGDGRDDLVTIKNNNRIFLQTSPTYFDVYFSTPAPFPSATTLRNNFSTNPVVTQNLESGLIEILSSTSFDDDDDGNDEVYITYTRNLDALPRPYFVKRITYTNGQFFASTVLTESTAMVQNFVPSWHNFSTFHAFSEVPQLNRSAFTYAHWDVTGDNIPELVTSNQNGIKITLLSNQQPSVNLLMNDIIKIKPGDFDGNGIVDLFVLRRTQPICSPVLFQLTAEIYTYDFNTSSLILVASTVYNPGITVSNLNCVGPSILDFYSQGSGAIDFGDFNGDGKTDIIHLVKLGNSTANIYVDLSNGNNLLSQLLVGNAPTQLNGFDASFFAFDANNDGLADLGVSSYNNLNPASYFTYYPSNGNLLTPAAPAYSSPNKYVGTLGDFDGDGAIDYVGQIDLVTLVGVDYNIFDHNNKKMVNHIFNLKNDYKIEYNLLANKKSLDGKPLYQKTTIPNGFNSPKSGLFVTTSTNNNGLKANYAYENVIFKRVGKGFLGFEKMYTSKTSTLVGSPNPYYHGSVNSTTFSNTFDCVVTTEILETGINQNDIFITIPSKLSALSKTQVNFIQPNSNRYLVSTVTEQKDFLKGTRHILTTNYDNNNLGQPLSELIENKSGLSPSNINSSQTNYFYTGATLPGGATYIKLQQLSKTMLESGGGTSNYNTEFVYDLTGHLTSKTENANITGSAVTTSYSQFNDFGSPKNTVITTPDLPQPRSTQFDYDNTGRFVTKTTNALGNFVETIFEPGLGNILHQKSLSGLIKSYSYNGLGQLVKIIYPAGAIDTYNYEWYAYTDNNIVPPTQVYAPVAVSNIGASGITTQYHDIRGNTLRSLSTGFNGNTIETLNTFDVFSRPITAIEPRFTNQATYQKIEYTYDEFLRPRTTTIKLQNNNVIKTTSYLYNLPVNQQNPPSFSGFTRMIEPAPGGTKETSWHNNSAGQNTLVTNFVNGVQHSLIYTYNERNQPKTSMAVFPGSPNTAISFSYDAIGTQTLINDPSSGISTYQYNSIGELINSSTPNGSFTYSYDQLGRILTKNVAGMGAYNYQYITAGNGLQQVEKIIGPDATTEFSYDAFFRTIQKKETITNGMPRQFTTQYTYDVYDRLLNHTYPSGFVITNQYDVNGYLSKIKNNNNVIWELQSMQTPALVTSYKINNGAITTSRLFDNNLNLNEINFGTLSKQTYTVTPATGNLTTRRYENFATNTNNNENFAYDPFDRLVQRGFENPQQQITSNITYQPNGNILSKSDCGDYVYNNQAQPYRLTQVNNQTGNISLNQLNATYNTIKKVSQITEDVSNKEFNFLYGNSGERIKMEYKIGGQNQYTRFYQDHYDRQENNNNTYKEWSYIYSPEGLAAVYYNNNGAAQLLYSTTDNLGNIIMLIDAAQNIVAEYSFDAWGRRRKINDWNDYSNVLPPNIMIRGFTGHEHLDEVGLINMNGRIYDPVLGRFIQADNFIQAPDNLQNFNRYSYALNNPLKYTDPDGNFIGIVGWGMGFIVNAAGNAVEGGHENIFVDAYHQTNDFFNIVNSATRFSIYNGGGTQVSLGLDVFALGISLGVTQKSGDVTAGATFGIGLGGVSGGGSVSYTSPEGFGASIGIGATNNSYSFGGSLSYKGTGAGYSFTKYGNSANNPINKPNPQSVGAVSIFGKNWSFRAENDFFTGSGDKWRTGAMEVTVGKFSVGFTIYTNEPVKGDLVDFEGKSKLYGGNNRPRKETLGAWINGVVYDSPVWFGYNTGAGVSRIGYSHPAVQDVMQNGIHKYFPPGHQNFYNQYDANIKGFYIYNGFYNPYSLYGK